MIWRDMNSNDTAGLFLPIGSTMNRIRCREMLKDKLEIHMAIHKCNMFMQDGAPCHRSKLVSDIFKRKNIKTLNWPGNSPDINLICLFIYFYFISIFILLTRRKATEALIHRVGNYPDLLPEIPRYCCPLVI